MNYQEYNSLTKKVKARILMINETIRNTLTSLSIEGNFDSGDVSIYLEQKNKAIEYTQNAEGLRLILNDLEKDVSADISTMASQISLKVKKKDAVTELNAETSGIYFRSKLFLVDTPNFKVTENSCYVNGTVYASKATIGGWTFQNGNVTGTASSTIEGGEIHADSATCSFVEADQMDLNPDRENTYHNVNMNNARLIGDASTSKDLIPQFSEISSYSTVNINEDLNIKGDMSMHCTALTARGTSGYNTIFCTEIVTEEESWSDERLKENVNDITANESDLILSLRPVTFKFKKNDATSSGFIAQELKREAEKRNIHSLTEKVKGYYAVNYRELIPLMISEIQENIKRIEMLKEKNGNDQI